MELRDNATSRHDIVDDAVVVPALLGVMEGAMHGTVWPPQDTFRLLGLLEAKDFGTLLPASSSCRKRFQEPVHALRRAEADPKCGALEEMEMREALRDLQSLVAEAQEAFREEPCEPGWDSAWQELASLEATLQTEMRYVYAPDWEIKPGKLVSRKGTWLKRTAQFSWELREGGERAEKLYLPAGVAVPVLQIGKVVDQEELKLHDWVCQHLRVWMKPEILQTIEARYGTWFVYWPHFEDANVASKTEDTDECPTSRQCVSPNVLKACPMPAKTHQNDDDSEPELLNASGEGEIALNSSPTGWKRFVRPLANCIACGDVETEMSGLKKNIRSKSKSLEACRHKLRERDSHAMLVEEQLEKTMKELSSVKKELEMERRRTAIALSFGQHTTSSMSSMLLSDSVSQQKLQEQVKLAEEQLKDAQQEIGRLSSSLDEEKSERQTLAEALQVKSSEAEICSERLQSTRGELKRCSDELQDLRCSLEDSNETSTRLHGELQEHSQQNANLKERLQQREFELEKCESEVHEVSSELSQTSRKLTQTESEREVIERRLAETKAQLDEYEERLTSLSASLEAAQRETASRSKRMEMTSMAAEDFRGHLHISKARVRHLEEQARATTALLETKHQEQLRLVEQAAAAEEQVEVCQGKLASLTSCLEKEQSQSAALRQELQNRDQQIEDLVTRASSQTTEVECLSEAKGSLTKALKAQEDQVECLTEEKGSLTRSLKAQEEENEELKSQISAMNQQVSDYERRVTELCETLSETQLENAQMALSLERRAMEAEEFLGRIREERRQVADFEQSLRSIRESLHRSLTDKDDLTVELERTCLEREDLTQQLLRAQQKLVQLEEEIGNSFLKAAEDSKQVRESSAQEICQWQITAEMAYRQTTEIALQLDNWRSQYSSLLKALQEKQVDAWTAMLQAIEKLNGELDEAKKRLAEVAIVDDAEMATLKEQLTQANARLNALSAAVDLKDTEPRACIMVCESDATHQCLHTAEDYLGQVKNMKDRDRALLVFYRIDLSRYSSELTVARMEKDRGPLSVSFLWPETRQSQGLCTAGFFGNQLGEKWRTCESTDWRNAKHEDATSKVRTGRGVSSPTLHDSKIEDLSCELTALRIQRQDSEREATQSIEVMRSTLQEQLHQNELLSAELTRKRMDCQDRLCKLASLECAAMHPQATSAESRNLRDELTAALDAKSDANCQLEGLKELAKHLQEELLCSQQKQVTMCEELDSMTNSSLEVCKQQANEKEALSNELRSSAGSVQHLQSQLAKYRQHLKESQSKIDSLTRSLKREVQKKDEAATRCAELLCSHPSMCIEAWIGRVRTFRDTAPGHALPKDSWQLVAGSGYEERVILKGGETSGRAPAISGETPCIIINAARGRKDRKDDDKVPVRVYNAKKPGAVAVQKAAPHMEVQIRTSWFTTRTLESFVHIPTTLPLLVLPRPRLIERRALAKRGLLAELSLLSDRGLSIVPAVDTWLKRSCQMSGELQPFELMYAPRGLPINVAQRPAIVDEDWEKGRHQHIHLHRKVVLASPPITMKQEQYDILVGQPMAMPPSFRLVSGKALPVSDSAVYVGDARLQLARDLQVAPARLQLLGPTPLEDSLPLAVLPVDVQVWILPDLAENRLAKLAGVEKFDDLQEIVDLQLQLSSKSLKTLPERFGLESFCKMTALKQLVILQCNMPALPPSFVELPSLEELTIAGSGLESLPQEIGQMVTLRLLHLTDNSLKNLPESLGMLGHLRKLEADRNQLLQLPASLLDCPDLAVLSLSKNMLKNFLTPARPANLQVLHLEGNRMSNLQLVTMPYLQEVYIDANPLRPSLPNSCGELGSLRRLEATGCLLETLPSSFPSLRSLEKLDISRNKLRMLPDDWGQLRSLKRLAISGNRLQHLPESFGDLISLQTCHLNANELTKLPESFGRLQALEELCLAENCLTVLPSSFAQLIELRCAVLTRNRLASLHEDVWKLPNLQTLVLDGNSLDASGKEVMGPSLLNQQLVRIDPCPLRGPGGGIQGRS
eukprot:s3234_g20.t1